MLLTLRIAILLLLVYPALSASSSSREEWLPITPEELKMTSEPKAPGAPAIYLYRQVDRDDIENREFIYARIKIFTEEGRKYANIELPFLKGAWDIKDIQARTIHPDGTILDFSSSIFEKTIVKAKGLKYLAKTFTLSEVQTGSIIEYRYTRTTRSLYDSRWILSEELFTKRAKFSLRPNRHYTLQWHWPRGLPEGTSPPVQEQTTVRLETQNVPAFQIEDFMPPPEEINTGWNSCIHVSLKLMQTSSGVSRLPSYILPFKISLINRRRCSMRWTRLFPNPTARNRNSTRYTIAARRFAISVMRLKRRRRKSAAKN